MDEMEHGNPEEPYECWCLRVCSYNDGGYGEEIAFLFLEELPEGEDRFRRIGAGVTEVLADAHSVDHDWDRGKWTTFQVF